MAPHARSERTEREEIREMPDNSKVTPSTSVDSLASRVECLEKQVAELLKLVHV